MADRYDENLILGYVEGELDAAQSAQFEALLAQDPRLRGLVEAMRQDRLALRDLPDAMAPAEVMERVNLHMERAVLATIDYAFSAEERSFGSAELRANIDRFLSAEQR